MKICGKKTSDKKQFYKELKVFLFCTLVFPPVAVITGFWCFYAFCVYSLGSDILD